VGSICLAVGHTTNNVAEYLGLIEGMRAAIACGIKRLRAQGDSKLVVEQVRFVL
jgi:ribonuclease HI